MNVLKELENIGIIPVVCIENADDAVSLAGALLKGGISAAEVTFRTDAAEEAIKRMSQAFPEMVVGAGTVLTIEQAQRAVNAGSRFIVSPGFNPKVVKWCVENDVAVIPGCTTPSEIEQAIELGLDTVKFFPAEQSGGLPKIKALAAPYVNMKFMPTGGINLANMNEYLAFKKIIACGGSFMVSGELLKNKDWDKVTALSKEAVRTMLGLKIRHIGINSENDETAKTTADLFANLLGIDECDELSGNYFAGDEFEIMKSCGKGKCGHIAIGANNVERAVYYLRRRGFKFLDDTAAYDDNGNLKFIYLDADFGGFAVHLTKN